MSGGPLVSVVMATRNAERFLGDALDSIAAQTYSPIETIVVDKASSDRSVAIAESYGARCVQQRGSGYAGAWNEGIELAAGELIGMLDSDDVWVPEKLEAQVRLLTERPELDYVIGRARFFIEPGYPPPPGLRPELLEGTHVAPMPGVLLARRSVFETVGPFRTDMTVANDVEWFARLKDAGLRSAVADDAVINKRMHDTNLSHFEAKDMNREILGALRDSVARRRAQGP
jgi:glycosyltransferase involved in cell wall biosynthesis